MKSPFRFFLKLTPSFRHSPSFLIKRIAFSVSRSGETSSDVSISKTKEACAEKDLVKAFFDSYHRGSYTPFKAKLEEGPVVDKSSISPDAESSEKIWQDFITFLKEKQIIKGDDEAVKVSELSIDLKKMSGSEKYQLGYHIYRAYGACTDARQFELFELLCNTTKGRLLRSSFKAFQERSDSVDIFYRLLGNSRVGMKKLSSRTRTNHTFLVAEVEKISFIEVLDDLCANFDSLSGFSYFVNLTDVVFEMYCDKEDRVSDAERSRMSDLITLLIGKFIFEKENDPALLVVVRHCIKILPHETTLPLALHLLAHSKHLLFKHEFKTLLGPLLRCSSYETISKPLVEFVFREFHNHKGSEMFHHALCEISTIENELEENLKKEFDSITSERNYKYFACTKPGTSLLFRLKHGFFKRIDAAFEEITLD